MSKFTLVVIVSAVAALSGCVSSSDLAQVRTLAERAQESADSAQRTANTAKATADAASAKADEATTKSDDAVATTKNQQEKIDRMFKKTMAK